MITWTWRRGDGELPVAEYRVSFWGDKHDLEMDVGNGCTTV